MTDLRIKHKFRVEHIGVRYLIGFIYGKLITSFIFHQSITILNLENRELLSLRHTFGKLMPITAVLAGVDNNQTFC